MFSEKDGKHHLPHIHALYSGQEVVVSLDGNVLEGKIPNKQLKLLLAWIEIHRDELLANWELLGDGEPSFKIEPLR
jgi:hypothetical protein